MAVAKGLSIYMNGVDLADAIQSFTPLAEVEELDNTALAAVGNRSFESGFKSGSVNGSGVWKYDQTNLDEIHNIMSAAFTSGTEGVFTGSLEALAIDGIAILLNPIQQSFNINTPLGQLIIATFDLRSNIGIGFGRWLFNAAVVSTTTDGTTVDNGAPTSNGGVFHYHAQNPSSLAGDIKIQHSVDDAVWVTLDTLALVGTPQEKGSSTIVAGTTIERYIRAQATATGGTITFQAAFARI